MRKIILDSIDRSIINAFSVMKNPTNRSIAEMIHIDASTVSRRLKRMYDENILLGISLALNLKKLEAIHKQIIIHYDNYTTKRQVLDIIENDPAFIRCIISDEKDSYICIEGFWQEESEMAKSISPLEGICEMKISTVERVIKKQIPL